MNPTLDIAPFLEMGTLRAAATLQDPDVRLTATEERPACMVIEEGGVVVELEFPDTGSLRRFQHRVASLSPTALRRKDP